MTVIGESITKMNSSLSEFLKPPRTGQIKRTFAWPHISQTTEPCQILFS